MSLNKPIYNLDSDSSEEIHPNIDKKSFKNWKSFQKEKEKEKLEERLKIINSTENLTENMLKEKTEIEQRLKPIYKDLADDSFRTAKEEVDNEDKHVDALSYLICNPNIESFIDMINLKISNLSNFEELVLLNLSNQIKCGDDEVGLILCEISLYTKYAVLHGRGFIEKLAAQLTKKENKEKFMYDVSKHYEESKKAIMSLYPEGFDEYKDEC